MLNLTHLLLRAQDVERVPLCQVRQELQQRVPVQVIRP